MVSSGLGTFPGKAKCRDLGGFVGLHGGRELWSMWVGSGPRLLPGSPLPFLLVSGRWASVAQLLADATASLRRSLLRVSHEPCDFRTCSVSLNRNSPLLS